MAPYQAPSQPSQEQLERRRLVGVNAETVTDVSSVDFPGHYPGEDHSWDAAKFRDNFQVKFYQNDPLESSFSLIGLDASVANAFRRILLSEIWTLAIEYVFVYNNTSIIQDEVLAQRLGLIPFKGNKKGLRDFLRPYHKPEEGSGEKIEGYDYNTIILALKIECTRNDQAARGETNPHKAYHNAHVYAKDIVFKPYGEQTKYFSGEGAIQPTNPDILIAKMRPGQCIDVEMHAVMGIGSDHAKFSPVATASYRLLPSIQILKPIIGKDAKKFAACFPQGVIDLEPVTKKDASKKGSGFEGHEGEMKAVVKDAMKDTVSRECLRHKEFEGKVKLGRVRDHFIFSIESLGQFDSEELFIESIQVLRKKCLALKENLSNMVR
ncbi:putative DNA-directed RNA polymerase I and III subunit Rpc40 [Mollisia scopiformis]|uniref:DNA-directed RNA polymerases I and III subunit RPAC1 n=1 Tax=Mollisia scopiformis TaxID=149040 RepID=A0A194XRC8_MOLSC|nr:putative DNA-directed RNA polymerase I and III subunit Rpc40 [Mollisia scopiformis]KUJ22282.1 putative DNA-directed RNA polymerase I and III subunit Rpc40 [Mollisia scopiformis]